MRKKPSKRIFWSMKTARRNPKIMAPLMKVAPNKARLAKSVAHRSLAKSKSYCLRPTQSDLGSILELEKEILTVHKMPAK